MPPHRQCFNVMFQQQGERNTVKRPDTQIHQELLAVNKWNEFLFFNLFFNSHFFKGLQLNKYYRTNCAFGCDVPDWRWTTFTSFLQLLQLCKGQNPDNVKR